jgi:hypothetical protein
MTTSSTNGDGTHWSEPRETPAAVVAANGWEGWETWLRSHLDIERDLTVEVVGEVVAALRVEIADAVEKRVAPLAREIAELVGAVGVLKGLGPPPGIRFRGSYVSDADYSIHDIVAKNGSSFVALRDRPGVCPGEHWQLVASKGNRGERGVPGPRGQVGGRGERAPGIKAWLIDKTKFTASPILADGSIGVPLELKGLFQEFLDQTRAGT